MAAGCYGYIVRLAIRDAQQAKDERLQAEALEFMWRCVAGIAKRLELAQSHKRVELDYAVQLQRSSSMNTQPQATITQFSASNLFPVGLSVMLKGEQTGGTLAVVFISDEPDLPGPPLHVHTKEDEWFLIIEGDYSFYADGRWTDVNAGTVVYFPRGVAHCYRNIGTTTGRHWIVTTPAGFEQFLPRFDEEMAKPNGPDWSRIDALNRDYGMEYLGEQPPRGK